MKKSIVSRKITAQKKHFLLIVLFMNIMAFSYAQYPHKITWGTRDLGQGISFSVNASINEPSMGMQTVTYTFVNKSYKKVQLNWKTILTLSDGSEISNDHEYTFGPGESKFMGWGGEGDIVDIKKDGGTVSSISIPYNKVTIEE